MLPFTEESVAERNVLALSLCVEHDYVLSTYNDREVFGIRLSLTCGICDILFGFRWLDEGEDDGLLERTFDLTRKEPEGWY